MFSMLLESSWVHRKLVAKDNNLGAEVNWVKCSMNPDLGVELDERLSSKVTSDSKCDFDEKRDYLMHERRMEI